MGIAEALKSVRDRINGSAVKAGRDSDNIKLVAVTKTVSPDRIIEAVRAGVTIVGENRVQEAQKKISDLRSQISVVRPEWHFIGHLQTNKTKTAVRLFDLIHSVDSTRLAEELNRQAAGTGKEQRILVEVKLSGEKTKHGIDEKDLMELLVNISYLKNIRLEGLMTIPPFFDAPEKARPYFKRLREIRDDLARKGFRLPELSMGMSGDFEVAIEEGATMVRIGTAIFGERGT